MAYILVCLAAFAASGLTLFSGFGLGTLLLPVFALVMPVPLAVAATAVVHFLNNLLKLALLGRHAAPRILWRFGAPAVVSAWLGAWLLVALARRPPLVTYQLFHHVRSIEVVKIIVAALMVSFALLDVLPRFQRLTVDQRWLPLGGVFSGFFGGLSGHQGALRSAFLMKCGLSKEQFLGTGVIIACVVDLARMMVYGSQFAAAGLWAQRGLLSVATAGALLGAWISLRFIARITLRTMQLLVAILLGVIAAGLASGLL